MKVTNQQMLDWIKETVSQRRLILSSERREGTMAAAVLNYLPVEFLLKC